MSRFDYVKYDDLSSGLQAEMKRDFENLSIEIETHLEDGRAKSLVLTKLEEAYMWIGKSIRDSQIERYSSELQEERKNG